MFFFLQHKPLLDERLVMKPCNKSSLPRCDSAAVWDYFREHIKIGLNRLHIPTAGFIFQVSHYFPHFFTGYEKQKSSWLLSDHQNRTISWATASSGKKTEPRNKTNKRNKSVSIIYSDCLYIGSMMLAKLDPLVVIFGEELQDDIGGSENYLVDANNDWIMNPTLTIKPKYLKIGKQLFKTKLGIQKYLILIQDQYFLFNILSTCTV